MFNESPEGQSQGAGTTDTPADNENAAQVPPAQPLTKFAEAVAYVVSRGYAVEGATSIVEEWGWAHILKDKEEEENKAANPPTEMRPLNSVNDESAQQELPADSVKCPSCGVNYAKGDAGCPNCGTPKPG